MSNDLTKFFGNNTPLTDELLAKATGAMVGLATSRESGTTLLRLTKVGEWVMGADNELVETGSVVTVDPLSFSAGYVAWHGGQIEGEVMHPIFDMDNAKFDLKPVQAKKGWEPQLSMHLVLDDIKLIYKTSSRGGLNAIRSLAALVASQLGGGNRFCQVTLGIDSYRHKEFGVVFVPMFGIVGWVDVEGKPTGTKLAAPEQTATNKASLV